MVRLDGVEDIESDDEGAVCENRQRRPRPGAIGCSKWSQATAWRDHNEQGIGRTNMMIT